MALLNPINLIPPQYRILAATIAAVVIVGALFGGGYYVGHTFTKNHYVAVITKMERDAAKLETEKAELQRKLEVETGNIKERVITKYVDRVKVIKQKEYIYREQANNNVPDRTVLSNGWVYLHNTAVAGSDADSTRSADATPSGVEANQALGTVTDNYSACRANAEQLISLQEYVREVQRVVAEANEKLKSNDKK